VRRVTILQGDHAVSGEQGVVMSTLLGSCIAVCLHDPVARLGGMNHFLLGAPAATDRRSGGGTLHRYGVHAMEVLINALMTRGASRARLAAHCYGGADIVLGFGKIGTQNAAFTRRFLAAEGIPIVHEDLGGRSARRVEFLPHAGKARCTRTAEVPVTAPLPSPSLAPAAGEVELF
jgi:chemotaxis protein CheD